MKKTVGFGDYLLRLNPPGYQRFMQANTLELNYTGAEANVCASLSMMGVQTEFVTKLPNNDIALSGVATLRKLGVGTRYICYGGERMGVFYLEKGASQRPSKVIYDRRYTSVATASRKDFNWTEIFEDAGWLHITGITPALSDSMPEICIDACAAAKNMGLTVSCDLNYRKNLWSPQQARPVMERILHYVDVLIANEEDAQQVLGLHPAKTDVTAGKLDLEGYIALAEKIGKLYDIQSVGTTLRKSISASDNEWQALFYTNGKSFISRNYAVHIVDRVGGGDSFAAGLIYSLQKDFAPQRAVEYAAAASCLKHSIEMDYNLSTPEEVERLVAGDASGRVQR